MGWLAWRSGGKPGFLTRFMLLLLLWVLSSSSTLSVLLGTARPGRVPGVRQTWGTARAAESWDWGVHYPHLTGAHAAGPVPPAGREGARSRRFSSIKTCHAGAEAHFRRASSNAACTAFFFFFFFPPLKSDRRWAVFRIDRCRMCHVQLIWHVTRL
ncbi:uncharacterized protein IWZ02DRAFT_295204 [Phyllosticta citriasiana]|uniref:uncharacterized protein n=1 Tax=Phyllosticta citriasiana TaxID=595635 RepID=UPI0030FD3DF2